MSGGGPWGEAIGRRCAFFQLRPTPCYRERICLLNPLIHKSYQGNCNTLEGLQRRTNPTRKAYSKSLARRSRSKPSWRSATHSDRATELINNNLREVAGANGHAEQLYSNQDGARSAVIS